VRLTRPFLQLWIPALLASPSADLLAQAAPPPIGARVRVTAPPLSRDPIVGRLVRVEHDTLWIDTGSGRPVTAIPGAASLRLEQSRGRRSYALVGGLIGAGVGAGLTLLFLDGFCGGDNLCDGDEEVRAALVFGVPAAAAGTLVGALIHRERWEVVPVVMAPDRRAPAFGLRLRLRF
jgi:hypothetical protein